MFSAASSRIFSGAATGNQLQPTLYSQQQLPKEESRSVHILLRIRVLDHESDPRQFVIRVFNRRESILICASRPLILQVIGHDPAAVKAQEHEEQAEAEEEEEETE